MTGKGGRGRRPIDAISSATTLASSAPRPAPAPRPRFVYVGPGGHARPVVSAEDHDPATERGRRAICHLMALADCERAAYRSDIAHIRHCQARALYLHEHVGPIARLSLDALLRRPPVASLRSLLPEAWAEGRDTAVVGEG